MARQVIWIDPDWHNLSGDAEPNGNLALANDYAVLPSQEPIQSQNHGGRAGPYEYDGKPKYRSVTEYEAMGAPHPCFRSKLWIARSGR
jgi:hypothetical protein